MDAARPILLRSGTQWMFWCAPCDCLHGPNDTWSFNGNTEKPTFSPSVLSTGERRCHLYVTDGQLHYLSDSDHALAGQTVPMEPIPWL